MAENELAVEDQKQQDSTVATEPAPGESAPGESATGESAPGESAPGESTLRESAPAEGGEEVIKYDVKIEDAGPATKKVSIEIPREVIDAKLEEQFKTIRKDAAVPGFRQGHAPQRLIEKRFASDVREQVRRTLISESYENAVEKHSLKVIGEPQFDNPDEIKLPDTGNLVYSFQIEVQPEFTLPPLTGLKVKRPKVAISEDHVDTALKNLRQQQGALVPVEDRGIEKEDTIIADVHLKVDGEVVMHEHDAQLQIKPASINGIAVEDFAERLAGMKPGETREFTVKAPDTHPDEKIRGKDVVAEFALKDIKRVELAEITPAFLTGLGFNSEADLREALRRQMEERVNYDIQQTMREQVNNYLLESVQMELPTNLSERQIERVLQRRLQDLRMRGVSEDQIQSRLEEFKAGAKEEFVRDSKLFFILQKVAAERNVDVSEGELNGRISIIAAQLNRRPEKLRQDMSADGQLMQLYVQMREQKAVDQILKEAVIEEVEPPAKDANAPAQEAK